jgi:hypothetical protein
MSVIVACIGVLMLGITWRYVIRPTVLDIHRDALFHIRASLRRDFASHGALDTNAYRAAVGLVNRHIRYIEHGSFTAMVIAATQIKQRGIERMVITAPDEQLGRIVEGARSRAGDLVASYLLLSSFPWMIVTLGLLPCIAVTMQVRTAHGAIQRASRWIRDRLIGENGFALIEQSCCPA